MKHQLIFPIILFLLVLPVMTSAAARNLPSKEAASLIAERNDLYLLDVRTVQEYQQARLEKAHLIPIDQLVKRLVELPKNRPILVYCAVGSRSAQVVNYLARRGYPEVYNLEGGIYAWAQQGLPYLQGGP